MICWLACRAPPSTCASIQRCLSDRVGRRGWRCGPTRRPQGIQNPIDLVMAVGASLRIEPPARPLIVGRFGHSDRGDGDNRARNYVGDMRYNRASSWATWCWPPSLRYGSGQIVVLGDTTPLGSVNLMTAMPFHARLLDWVTAERISSLGSCCCSNGWLAAAAVRRGRSLFGGRQEPARPGRGGSGTGPDPDADERGSMRPRVRQLKPQGRIAYVDVSHQERFDRMLWEDDLHRRAGLQPGPQWRPAPAAARDRCRRPGLRQSCWWSLRQASRFSAQEVETINRWVRRGGRLLVSAGL